MSDRNTWGTWARDAYLTPKPAACGCPWVRVNATPGEDVDWVAAWRLQHRSECQQPDTATLPA